MLFEIAPQPDVTPVYKTIGDVSLRLHIFSPAGHTPADCRPGIVFFFGGGWAYGAPSQFYRHSAYLASRGMLAMVAEYRVRDKHGTPPSACVEDAKSAIRWLRRHADELGLDPDRLAARGVSAGGQMAAATGLVDVFNAPGEDTSVSARPDALVLFNPAFDNGPDGFAHDRVIEYWQDFSPLHNIHPGAPPTAIFVGTEDHILPVPTAERYRDLMQQAGARCDLHLYEGQKHSFFNYGTGINPYFYQTLTSADRFLTSLGYLDGEPTLKQEASA
jgi:acetyl esterase/lipase